MKDQKFKLPTSSLDRLKLIIRAYGHHGKPASLDEIGGLAGVGKTEVSGNNGFLMSIGAIDGGNRKGITDPGKSLASALDHEQEMPEEVERNWHALIAENEFMQKIISAVRVRNGMEPSALEAHIAYSAGQPKRSAAMTGARAVVGVLCSAGLLKDAEGRFVAVSRARPTMPLPDAPSAVGMIRGRSTSVADVSGRLIPVQGDAQISIAFRIDVRCTKDELSDIGQKLKGVLSDLGIETSHIRED